MELREYARVVRKRWAWAAAVVVLGAGAGIASVLMQSPTYEAVTQVVVSTQSGETSIDLAQSNTYTLSRVKTYAQLASSERVLERVAQELGVDTPVTQLGTRVSATPVADTTIIRIAATSGDPDEAARLANATAGGLSAVVAEVESIDDQPSPVRVSTIARASVPQTPISPRPALRIGGFLVAALVLGVGVAVLRDAADTRIRSHREVEALTTRPLVGTIGLDRSARQRPLIMIDNPRSGLAESYRTLRTNLQFLGIDDAKRSYVVTSALPAEGKSTLCANLAIALAGSGQTVLLIDADLRKPAVASYLGLEGGVGLTNLLVGRAEIDDAIQEWSVDGMYVLPAGRVPPNPSELVGSQAMTSLLRSLEQEFDWIIIDAPPLLPVTDAAVLAAAASGAIMTVAAGRTKAQQFQSAMSALEVIDAPVAGVVLTMVGLKESGGYGYGTESGYGQSSRGEDGHAGSTLRQRARRILAR